MKNSYVVKNLILLETFSAYHNFTFIALRRNRTIRRWIFMHLACISRSYAIAAIISDSEMAKSLKHPAQLRMRSVSVPTLLIVF